MQPIDRRQLLRSAASTVTLAAFPGLAPSAPPGTEGERGTPPALRLATFACDVTPPLRHPLCGGWIAPARAVDDPLQALGVILLGVGRPVVLCAVDWCGLRNEAHAAWQRALAEAAQTVPERVAVQCVHQHNAPFADLEAQHLLASVPGAPPSLVFRFFDLAVRRTADAVRACLKRAEPLTHIGTGQARVEQVASNRRILGPDRKVQWIRYSSTRDPKIRAAPVGLIDPWLRTLSFWNGTRPLAALHYYATHPMSYYGDGRVSSDFAGLARRERQEEDSHVLQVYFTGCAGNITAGKYNDGAHANRLVLRDRLHAAMKSAWEATRRQALTHWEWRVEPVKLPPRAEPSFGEEASRRVLEDSRESKARRVNAAFQLAWLMRASHSIDLTCLDLGPALVVHLPGEPFIEYQIKAQELRPDAFVCVAGYGDGGPGYIPTARAYAEGGYEPTVALAGPDSERLLYQALARLLRVPARK